MFSTDKNLHVTRKERDYLNSLLIQRYNWTGSLAVSGVERETLKQLIAKLDMVPLWD